MLGAFQLGYHEERGLKLTLESERIGRYHTKVQDIKIPNLSYGREVYTLGGPFTIDWSGEFYCPEAGRYEFATSSTVPLRIPFATKGQVVAQEITPIALPYWIKGGNRFGLNRQKQVWAMALKCTTLSRSWHIFFLLVKLA